MITFSNSGFDTSQPNDNSKPVKSLLNCQKLVTVSRLHGRGKTSAGFRTANTPNDKELILNAKI